MVENSGKLGVGPRIVTVDEDLAGLVVDPSDKVDEALA